MIMIVDTQEEKDKFLQLFEKYENIIYYTAKRFVKDEMVIEDISQEVFIQIATHLDRIDDGNEKRARNYIITITRNLCKNFLRDQSKREEISFDTSLEYADLHDDTVEKMLGNAFREKLVEEIGKLDERYRIVLELKYVAQYSNDEIANMLDLKKKTVEMQIYRANKILRERMRDWIDE